MSWCPDEAKVRSKFIHAASVEGMKKAVPGISAFVQVRTLYKLIALFLAHQLTGYLILIFFCANLKQQASDDEQASMISVQDKLTRTVTAC